MDPLTIAVTLAQLVKGGVAMYESAQAVSDVIIKRRAEGKEVTVEDMRSAMKEDDVAKKVLEDAIANAQ